MSFIRFPARLDQSFNDGVRQRRVGDEDAAVVVTDLEVGTQSKVAVQCRLGLRTTFQVSQHRCTKAQMMSYVRMPKQRLVNRLKRLFILLLSQAGKLKHPMKVHQILISRAEFKCLEDGAFTLLILSGMDFS